MNYPLMRLNKKDSNQLTPQNSYYSKEYCERMCKLYLTDELHRNEHGKMQKYYRLHARDNHTQEVIRTIGEKAVQRSRAVWPPCRKEN